MNSFLKLKQELVEIGDSYYYRLLAKQLKKSGSVLDVGCGRSSPLKKVKFKGRSEGIDLYRKSITDSKKQHIHSTYKIGDIRKLSRYYKPKSFDSVIALDVIEHLKKKEALKLISDMENIATKNVVILTPNGYYKQDELDGNPYQVHQSGWTKDDFKRLGYRIYGIRGWQKLRGEHAEIKWKPWFFWGFCSFVSEYLLYYSPHLSFDLFAVKEFS
ncbi:hypothetical protein A3J20_01250 [Candidatus Gottesmanbacteria bacterium RIFCSPLOWO2_02_FULL_42_29]|uniref:Methyltransferase domain-containing protein n=1 Tax=Candidatus Gottesmanbacteria bacterium RIFCSPLOWO2_01_FULL_42_22 TaxID=1798391 RepID=A0A1F6BCL7_9BACT|nr:MAG: hypothetical protein A2781_05975 [Candidatus Gottesmanbacteria bacterium RIFCSPHIGHO2_01_FULL_42_27]OGG21988.1 MAG: hypothetical protein A3E72_00735 [Candidatus Gottesmanbacteria bacterium RIFCSPHIGHO2_12_FULL_43_26]OGG34699.1 MAG: hypothetical protein A2968_02805 [Candidatus Gottesmanbacteria bacterium RIFCSPLOWO2_01_FULL_42_22]OGG39207.1 MAG: hypothetical protein A3J20_01250 [Candidatus Gottesmanbacteria bacterium RIFCSPLOWO2_02_FULL_42_29]